MYLLYNFGYRSILAITLCTDKSKKATEKQPILEKLILKPYILRRSLINDEFDVIYLDPIQRRVKTRANYYIGLVFVKPSHVDILTSFIVRPFC